MPKGPRKLAITFGAVGLTHFGGIYLLHRFLTRIGFKAALAKEVTLAQRNNRYTVGELLLAILYPIILGLERIETTQLLQHNGVFRYLSGLPTYPDPSTLRRFLLRITPQALTRLRKLHDRFLAKMIAKPHLPSRLIFDLDLTSTCRPPTVARSFSPAPPSLSLNSSSYLTNSNSNCRPSRRLRSPLLKPQRQRLCSADFQSHMSIFQLLSHLATPESAKSG